jgi:hypothetical protein
MDQKDGFLSEKLGVLLEVSPVALEPGLLHALKINERQANTTYLQSGQNSCLEFWGNSLERG